MRKPRREATVGRSARMIAAQHAVAPGLTEAMMARMVDRHHFDGTPAPATPGNVLEPMPEWIGISGDWQAGPSGGSARAAVWAGLALLAVPLAFYMLRGQHEADRS